MDHKDGYIRLGYGHQHDMVVIYSRLMAMGWLLNRILWLFSTLTNRLLDNQDEDNSQIYGNSISIDFSYGKLNQSKVSIKRCKHLTKMRRTVEIKARTAKDQIR
ncbi:MAG: hypothetical protein EXX96DRAFT_539919 [Benjaminiella poitrasii]|nr:MAG: hypothetical protein EXX96DRAFT_539919 [Benjaminiella poitrasii]